MAKLLRWIGWLLLFLTIKVYGAPMEKFEYDGGACAPYKMTMTIIAANLNYDGGAVPLPAGSDIYGGWGISTSIMAVGDDVKPLPTSLNIIFFSYLENQFYHGKFTLPYDKMLKLFQQGYYSYNAHKQVTYNDIVVGVAPGGAVSVWVEGFDKYKEVFFGHAEKVDMNWSLITQNKMPREKYIYRRLLDSLGSPEAVAEMEKKGPPIGLWDRYRTRYHWQPKFTHITLREGLIFGIRYLNGEFGDIKYPIPSDEQDMSRVVPKEMNFVWAKRDGVASVITLHFDQEEIFSAFEKLGDKQDHLTLDVDYDKHITDDKKAISVWLNNGEEKIELKKTKIDEYGAGPKMY